MTILVGHASQRAVLQSALASRRMHHAWILAGPEGIGKAAFALAFATRLLAEAADPALVGGELEVDAEHRVARLVESGAHPDFVRLERVENDKGELYRNIRVDQVRTVQNLLGKAPSLSSRRVVLIDSADELERPAANALLKSLEEPPPDCFFLLVAHAPARLLPTIRSRCRVLRFGPLQSDEVSQLITRQLPAMATDDITALAAVSGGSIGQALALAGLGVAEMDETLDQIVRDGDPDNRRRLALARTLTGKAARARYEAFLERAPRRIAQLARTRSGAALADAIAAWEKARELAAGAVILTLDPGATVFEICSLLADLADSELQSS